MRFETVPEIEAAIKLIPDQAEYYTLLAILTSNTGDSRAITALQRAAVLNPSNARTWIELALRYEARGENKLAEESFRRAASEDKQYLPRWTLANFYFRQGNTQEFWRWANSAAEMLYAPLPALRKSCGRRESDQSAQSAVARPASWISRLPVLRRSSKSHGRCARTRD